MPSQRWFKVASVEFCAICEAGKYSSEEGATTTCPGSCPAGKSTAGDDATDRVSVDDYTECGVGKYSGDGEACTDCSVGQYSEVGSLSCSDCSAGKHFVEGASGVVATGGESSVCTDCTSGKFSPAGASVCTSCNAGKYSSSVGSSEDICVDCDAGKSSERGSTSCIICPIGTHSPPGSPCLDCEAGKFNENVQQESCTKCGTGRYSSTTGNVIESDCRNCEAGTASSEEFRTTPCPACPEGTSAPAPGLGYCRGCVAGTYSDSPWTILCDLCAKGKYTSAAQSTSCEECVAGTFNLVEGSVTCDKCPAGQKMNDAGDGCAFCPDGKYSSPGSTSCSNCNETPGYISQAGESGAASCEYCGPGFYADQASQTCKGCKIDTYSVGGVNECIICRSGTKNTVAATSCSPCPPGTIQAENTCSQCEKGEYGEFGATSCAPCNGDGQYADEAGLPACKITPAGKKPSSDHQGVENCPPGTYSIGGKSDCLQCEPGKFSSEGAVGCSQCEPGEVPSGKSCVKCEVGKFATFGSDACFPCDNGFVSNNNEGAGFCSPCPAGFFANPAKTTCVPCLPGTFSGIAAKKCIACEKGKFNIGLQNTGCNFCDDKDVLKGSTTANTSSASTSSCICEQGEFESDSTGICEVVDEGVRKSVDGMKVNTLDLEQGFWRTSNSSTAILRCLNPMHCKGGVETDDLCAEGYTGPLCAVCDSGYAAVGFGESLACNVCNPGSEATVAIVVVIVVLIFATGLAYYIKKDDREDSQSLLGQRSRAASEAISVVVQKFSKNLWRHCLP
ncbi:hypothetical protein TrVE_jg2610 [Triparma verrucosa]|uniref:Tyrosine-protein kinase ephrin type A/B receptor-like domain-containing protein n=1 Tax=Triparma verrucosa TaxID=1606542 RepID=A0A9W7BRU8_9STRA|nr:hypothetical protein TrVE_jg2610 [Triparma verrucosa]